MKELTKFLKYFLIVSSICIFFYSCDSGNRHEVKEESVFEYTPEPMTREDSIVLLAKELNIEFNLETDNIHDILSKVLSQKQVLISKLDSLDERMDEIETMAIDYTLRKNKEARDQLLNEINKVKSELDRINELTKKENVTQKDILKIPEEKINIDTKSLESLETGNYVTRLNKHYILPIYVTPSHEIIVGEPRLDSTTVIRGDKKISTRLSKELEQIKKSLNKGTE
jgi:hypothetical protein